MRVLVTGASGFIGSALVARLLEADHEVIGVSRSPERTADRLGLTNVIDWTGLDSVFQVGVDAVIHLAGESVQGPWFGKKAQRVSESRLDCTRVLVDAIVAADTPPGVLLSASGIGFYGEGEDALLDEAAQAGDDFFASLCVEWEAIALESKAKGCRVGLLRFGIVLGPRGGALKAMLLPTKLGIAGSLGGGKQWWSWVAISDAISAILFSMESDNISGPINIVSPEPIRQVDFQKALSRVTKRPSFMPAPSFALRVLLGTFAEEVLSSKRVVPAKLSEAGFTWAFLELEEALEHSVGARPGA